MSETRQLLLITHLPERSGPELLLMLNTDVRDARDRVQKKLDDVSHRYTSAGWAADPDGIHYEVAPGGKTIVATLQLTRPAS